MAYLHPYIFRVIYMVLEDFEKIYVYNSSKMHDRLFPVAWSRGTNGRNNPAMLARGTASVLRARWLATRDRAARDAARPVCMTVRCRPAGRRDRYSTALPIHGIVPAVGSTSLCGAKKSIAHYQTAVRVYFHKSLKTLYIIIKA